MLKRVYYFEPCPLAPVLRQLGRVGTGRRSRKGKTAPDAYEVIPIDRKGGERPRWELPAVIIADAGEDELARIEKIAPEEDEWRVIYLLRGASTPWFGSSQRVFAFLPDNAYRLCLAFLAVGVLWTILGGVAAYFAKREFELKGLMPNKTIRVLKGDKTRIQTEVNSQT